MGFGNGIGTSYKYIYNMHTENSEFPSDPFRYNRDVSNYSFDIVPINVRDEDGWIGKKMPPPIVPRKVPPISARHLPIPGGSRSFNRAVYDNHGC